MMCFVFCSMLGWMKLILIWWWFCMFGCVCFGLVSLGVLICWGVLMVIWSLWCFINWIWSDVCVFDWLCIVWFEWCLVWCLFCLMSMLIMLLLCLIVGWVYGMLCVFVMLLVLMVLVWLCVSWLDRILRVRCLWRIGWLLMCEMCVDLLIMLNLFVIIGDWCFIWLYLGGVSVGSLCFILMRCVKRWNLMNVFVNCLCCGVVLRIWWLNVRLCIVFMFELLWCLVKGVFFLWVMLFILCCCLLVRGLLLVCVMLWILVGNWCGLLKVM